MVVLYYWKVFPLFHIYKILIHFYSVVQFTHFQPQLLVQYNNTYNIELHIMLLMKPFSHISDQNEPPKKRILLSGDIDYSLPITTTYLKYMRSLGCRDEDAFKFDNKHVSLVVDRILHEIVSHYYNYKWITYLMVY